MKVVVVLTMVCLLLHVGAFAGDKGFSDIPDGVYRGEAEDYGGPILKLDVTISGGKIVDINVLTDGWEPYFTQGIDVIDDVIDRQSVDVDAVTGATITSKAILDAIESAISSARKK